MRNNSFSQKNLLSNLRKNFHQRYRQPIIKESRTQIDTINHKTKSWNCQRRQQLICCFSIQLTLLNHQAQLPTPQSYHCSQRTSYLNPQNYHLPCKNNKVVDIAIRKNLRVPFIVVDKLKNYISWNKEILPLNIQRNDFLLWLCHYTLLLPQKSSPHVQINHQNRWSQSYLS